MRTAIYISETVATIKHNGIPCGICATADATYDEPHHRLQIKLECHLRGAPASNRNPPEWLPKPEIVTESVSHSEASSVTKQIFQSYVNRIRRTLPATPPVQIGV